MVTSVRTGDTEVFLVDPTTGDATNLTRSPKSEDRYPCWSPDGKRFAFTSDRQGSFNLYVADVDGRNVLRLTDLRATEVAYMPSWAGDRIVFGLHAARAEIASVKPDGGETEILGPGHDPVLAPDKTRIAFTGEAPGGVTVFVMDADGSHRRQVVKEANAWGAVFPDWSPNGKRLVYAFKVGGGLELFTVDAEGATAPSAAHALGRCIHAGRVVARRLLDLVPAHRRSLLARPRADEEGLRREARRQETRLGRPTRWHRGPRCRVPAIPMRDGWQPGGLAAKTSLTDRPAVLRFKNQVSPGIPLVPTLRTFAFIALSTLPIRAFAEETALARAPTKVSGNGTFLLD